VSFKTSTRGEIAHLVIDSTGLKVFGEGEWKSSQLQGRSHEILFIQQSRAVALLGSRHRLRQIAPLHEADYPAD
ncbi:hypothetical protein J5619_23145, partial [Enterobacter ludwigii]|nr:hypothetical protein [Enterobacter ludwigii]